MTCLLMDRKGMTLSALDLYLGKIPSKIDSGIWDTAEETNKKVNKADAIGKKMGTGSLGLANVEGDEDEEFINLESGVGASNFLQNSENNIKTPLKFPSIQNIGLEVK